MQKSSNTLLNSSVNQQRINDSEPCFCKLVTNEKFQNILKSPKRQRSLFTANPVTSENSKFNVSAAPFVSAHSGISERDCANQPYMDGHVYSPLLHIPSMPYMNSPQFPQQYNGYDNRTFRSVPCRRMYSHEDGMFKMPQIPYGQQAMDCNGFADTGRPCKSFVTSDGIIEMRLREGIRISMAVDKAIRVINQRSCVAISLSGNGNSSALIHPNGRIYQYVSKVEIVAFDGMKNNNFRRYAKMWYKGVSFTSDNCALTYLVDAAGTRTTTDSFTDLTKDYVSAVFYSDNRNGTESVQEALNILQQAKYLCVEGGSEIIDINGFRITQTADGLVKITRNHNKCLIRTSPGNGSATLTTPTIHCTASLGKTSHLFVRRGERRMHFDGASFIVRNAGHSAGFDENNLLNVY